MFTQKQVSQALAFYHEINQYGKDNNMITELIAPGHVKVEMQVAYKHLSSPDACHGGVIAGLMDSVMGAAALSAAFTDEMIVSTIEFKINYLHSAFINDVLEGESKIDFHGKSVIVCNGTIRIKGTEKIIAKAIGTFNKYPISKKFNRV